MLIETMICSLFLSLELLKFVLSSVQFTLQLHDSVPVMKAEQDGVLVTVTYYSTSTDFYERSALFVL